MPRHLTAAHGAARAATRRRVTGHGVDTRSYTVEDLADVGGLAAPDLERSDARRAGAVATRVREHEEEKCE
jgi:hypothetical protein